MSRVSAQTAVRSDTNVGDGSGQSASRALREEQGAAAIAHRSRSNSRAEDRRPDQHRYADCKRDEGQTQGIDHDRFPVILPEAPVHLWKEHAKARLPPM